MEQEIHGYEVKTEKRKAAPQRRKLPNYRMVVDPKTGKRLSQYGKMYKKKAFAKPLPEGWDVRSWRLQIYSFLEECAEKHGCSVTKMLRDIGYDKSKYILWAKYMKEDNKRCNLQNLNQIQKIAQYSGVPFVLY